MRLNFFGNFVHPAKSYSSVTGLKARFYRKKWIRPYKGPFCVNNNHFVRINILLFFSITIFFRPLCVPIWAEKGRMEGVPSPPRRKNGAKNRTEWKFRPASIGPTDENMVCSALSCGLFFLAMEKMAHAKGRRRLSATP